MAQPSIEIIGGYPFHRLDGGQLFPVLYGEKGPEAPPPDPGLVNKQNQLLQMQIDNAKQSDPLQALMLKEAGLNKVSKFDQAGYDAALQSWDKAQAAHRARYGIDIPTAAYKDGYRPVSKNDFQTTSYEYADPVAAQQRQQLQSRMTQAQLDNLEKSKALEPIMMEQMGLQYDPATKTYKQLNPELAANKREIERLQTERSLKALRGELPVSETLKKELERGQLQLDEELYRQLGPGAKNSSAGAMRQREYNTMATQLKEGEQRDMLTTAEALAMNRGQFNQGQAQGYAAPRAATNSAYGFSMSDPMGRQAAFENPFAAQARMLAPAQQSLASARDQDNFSRNMIFEKNKLAGQERAGYIGAGLGLAGMGAGMFMMSDPAVKKDISDVSDAELLAAVTNIPVKRWKYKDDPEQREHLGGMADTMPDVVSDGKVVDVISYIGMLTGALRELNRKVSGEEELSPAMALAF